MPKGVCKVCHVHLDGKDLHTLSWKHLRAGLIFHRQTDVDIKAGKYYYLCDNDYAIYNIAGRFTADPPESVDRCSNCHSWVGWTKSGFRDTEWTVFFRTGQWCHKSCLPSWV